MPVTVRDLSESEIPFLIDYWFHSPPGYLQSIGIDPAKMPKEEDMRKGLAATLIENRKHPSTKLNALAILYDGEVIGLHTINPLIEDDHGIFHAHICTPHFRGKGIAMKSYPLALKIFFERFNLQQILFKTPAQNIGAIRVKEKLKIRCTGEEIIGFSVIKDGTLAKTFALTRAEAEALN